MGSLIRLLPHVIVESYLSGRVFSSFADASGLMYFGRVDAQSDEHVPIRGFTMSARTVDDHYMTGSVGGHDVTLIRRTDDGPRGRSKTVTRVIASVALPRPVPSVLLMSNAYPRDTYEAAFISLVRSEHIALQFELDANFLIYARKTDAVDLADAFAGSDVFLLQHPEYDYELCGNVLNVHMHATSPTLPMLSALLNQTVAMVESFA